LTREPTGAALATFRLVETWRSLRFLQLVVFTVIVLLLIPLQLRFRALWLVLSALYLNAVVVSLTAGRFRMRARWPSWPRGSSRWPCGSRPSRSLR
jgi:hypothetical protein